MPHFSSFDGTALYYDDQGDGAAVVLLHGFVGDVNIDWIRSGILDRLLDEGYRTIGYDARGHGLSDKPHDMDVYAGDALPNDTRALLDELGIERCALVGFSLGARTALRVAALDDRVTRVVALGLGEQSLQRAQRGMSMVPDAMLTDDPDSIEHESIRHFREMADAIHGDKEALAAAIGAPRPEIVDFIAEVTVPVLVVTGSDDVTAGAPDAFAAALPDGRAITTAGDHAGVKDQIATHAAIVEFLGQGAE
jgi:pimeloyl-ACP methyl ester carboxylesterase